MIRQIWTREALAAATLSALCVYALALLSPAIFNDADTFWHIRAGQWMIAHHAVLDHDIFSLPFAGRFWDTQEWLSEVLLAGAFQISGWSGVAVLTGTAMAATAALLALYLSRYLDPVPCIAVLALALGCVMPDYLARPHILALPFLTAWTIGLVDAADSQRAPHWPLLPLMAIWANLHGSFVLGLAFIPPLALDSMLAAKEQRARLAAHWCLFATASVVAALLNPRGLDGLLFPFKLMSVHSLSAIGEWKSLDLHTLNPVVLATAAGLFFLIWRGIRLSSVRVLLLLALLYQTLLHTRYGMILGIAGAVLVALPIGTSLKRDPASSTPLPHWRLVAAGIAALFVITAALRIAVPIRRGDEAVEPLTALAAVPPSLAAKPMFNNYSFGGILIWKGIRPLVDSRADFYGDKWLSQYAQAVNGDQATIDRLFQRYHVAWTLLEPADPLVTALDHRPGWHRLFTGPYAVVQAGPEAFAATNEALRAQN
ncbi:MAG TPA: hypothetical protein VGK90_12365 [Rhizomicrobium sp.]|jgi:hypothetical protein